MRVFITGVSGGIGRAVAEAFLKEGYEVTGIGRHFPEDLAIAKLELDLSDPVAVEGFEFPDADHATKAILINNAGTVGEIAPVFNMSGAEQQVMQVNLISPMILCRKFVRHFENSSQVIVNISSGAGKRPIPSWSAYCASKAGLDLFSETIQAEANEATKDLRVHAFSPGVVDTEMQAVIRSTSPEKFSSLSRFLKLHEEKALRSPHEVATDILRLLERKYPVIVSYTDLVG